MCFFKIENSLCVRESYDLQGLVVKSIGLTWSPFFIIENCTATMKNCSVSGTLYDLMLIAAEK